MSASQFPPLVSKPSTKHCTNCSAKMTLYTLPGHYGSNVEIDVCHDCNAIWFDQFESTMLSPDGTVALFQLIHERGGTSAGVAAKFNEGLRCVTCGDGMKLTNDQVKGTRFSYQACRKGHGRLTTFYNFLSEKQFVRELTRAERTKLAATVQQLRCSGCGAAINIGKVDACEYCRAPVSVFDRDAAKKAIDHYLQERQRTQGKTAAGERREMGRNEQSQWSAYDRMDLGSDILYALGRAAARGFSGGARTGGGLAGGAGASGGFAAPALAADVLPDVLPDAEAALFGAGLASGASETVAGVADTATSSLTEALGGGIGNGIGHISEALPSATDALFGTVASGASEIAGALADGLAGSAVGEAASLFSDVAASGLGDAVAEVGGSVAEAVGDGAVDLVVDGIGSLLGAIFS